MVAVCGGDACRFLAAVLKGVEAEISLASGGGMAVEGDYTAFFAELGVGVQTMLREGFVVSHLRRKRRAEGGAPIGGGA
jgi:hypothetical protein